MKWKKCKELISSDYSRIGDCGGGHGILAFCKNLLTIEPFMVTFWFRIGNYLKEKNNILSKAFRPVFWVIYRHLQHKTGIQLPIGTSIAGGIRFFHYSCIVIASSVRIGKNVSIHQGVTIGRVFCGKNAGVPTIGDNVVIFAGAKLIGNIHVGDNAVIGANAVVVKDVPANSVVSGVPAKIISEDSRKCFTKQWGVLFAHSYTDE